MRVEESAEAIRQIRDNTKSWPFFFFESGIHHISMQGIKKKREVESANRPFNVGHRALKKLKRYFNILQSIN